MILRWMKWLVLAAVAMLIVSTPMTLAQAPSVVSVFSIWVRLSLRGFSQEEIESLLRNMDAKTIADVKARLRRTVMANLQLKKIGDQVRFSRDKDDLNNVVTSVETEIRFAGMQNDEQLKLMIKDRYGMRLHRF